MPSAGSWIANPAISSNIKKWKGKVKFLEGWRLNAATSYSIFNNKKTILIIILFFLISIAGCGGFPGCGTAEKNSDKNAQGKKEMPKEIMDMEVSVLKIMHQADLIPLVELMSRQSDGEAGEQESILKNTAKP
jgi:predicted small lipoprotein YifL